MLLCFESVGDYLLCIKFNDEYIIDSPFRIYVSATESSGSEKMKNNKKAYQVRATYY